MFGEQAEPREILDFIAQRIGERLQEAAAAAGTGFVQEDVIDRAVMNFKTFDILTADVEDEVNIRHIFAAGGEMRHRFHDAGVDAEGAANQIFAIAGDAAGHDFHPRVGAHQFDQRFPDQLQRVALVGLIHRIQDFFLLVDQHHFDRRAAGVDAQSAATGNFFRFMNPDLIALMPLAEPAVFVLIRKQRRQGTDKAGRVHRLQLFDRVGEIHRFFR